MPSISKAQQRAAGVALAAKRGKRTVSSLRGVSRQMYESMTEDQLIDFAGTKRENLPNRRSS